MYNPFRSDYYAFDTDNTQDILSYYNSFKNCKFDTVTMEPQGLKLTVCNDNNVYGDNVWDWPHKDLFFNRVGNTVYIFTPPEFNDLMTRKRHYYTGENVDFAFEMLDHVKKIMSEGSILCKFEVYLQNSFGLKKNKKTQYTDDIFRPLYDIYLYNRLF